MTENNKEALAALKRVGIHLNAYGVQESGFQSEFDIKTIRTALQRNDLPQGFVLVPIEPTEEMEEVFVKFGNNVPSRNRERNRETYKAMLKAAPSVSHNAPVTGQVATKPVDVNGNNPGE